MRALTFDSTGVTWDSALKTFDESTFNVYTLSVPTDRWIDLYAETGIEVGTRLIVENIGVTDIQLITQPTQPALNSTTYNILKRDNGVRLTNTSGDTGAWAFSQGATGRIMVMVDEPNRGFVPSIVASNLPVADDRVQVRGAKNDLGYDAWGRGKAVTDYSVWYGMFTFNVPAEMWLEYVDGVEQAVPTNFTSSNGSLLCTGSIGELRVLRSKRHPRYQPNRGHLYSTAIIVDTPSNGSTYEFGLFQEQCGLFFRVEDGVLYGVRRNMVDGVVSESTIECDTTGIDLTKGNIYDLQMQWRGVGGIKFYVNLEQVAHFDLLGTLDYLSVFNPALPISFAVTGPGTMRCGCVDVTSEGGNKQTRIRGFIGSDETALSTSELPVAVIYLPLQITYNGVSTLNTRDAALRRVTGFANDATILRVYYTRNIAKFAGTSWANYDSSGTVQYATNGNITIDNLTTGLVNIATRRIEANSSLEIENPDPEYGDYYTIAGDIVLVTLQAKNSTTGGSGIEWGSEI